MVVTRVPATNCAHTYELAQNRYGAAELPYDWPFGGKLMTENVWDAFVILALLEDHTQCGAKLTVPHAGKQKDRFTSAMADRNERIIHEGQPEIAHYCDKCMRTYRDKHSLLFKVEAVVTDGLMIGHPCCAMAACPVPLANMRNRFCPSHADLHKICVVVGCESPVVEYIKIVDGQEWCTCMKTCSDPVHQRMECLSTEQSKANFQLSQRLMRQKVAHPNDALAETKLAELVDLEDSEEWFKVGEDDSEVHMFTINNPGATGELDADIMETCPTHPETRNRKLKAQFGRRRTHNEQVIVRPCGVISSRATFFAAKAVSNVLVSEFNLT